MEKTGIVTAVNGGLLDITFCSDQDCGQCHACDGGQKRTVVQVRGSAEVGDYAVVELPVSTVVKASLLAYALPIAGLMAGMLVGNAVSSSPAGTAVGGGVGLLLCLAAVWLTERGRQHSRKWQPSLVRVLPAELYTSKEEEGT